MGKHSAPEERGSAKDCTDREQASPATSGPIGWPGPASGDRRIGWPEPPRQGSTLRWGITAAPGIDAARGISSGR